MFRLSGNLAIGVLYWAQELTNSLYSNQNIWKAFRCDASGETAMIENRRRTAVKRNNTTVKSKIVANQLTQQ